MSQCPSCCRTCLQHGPGLKTEERILTLSKLLPLGTISLPVKQDGICYHLHAEDGWHPLDTNISNLTDFEDSKDTILALRFLAKNDFLRATTRYVSSSLLIRVYIIPNDLPGAGGRLSVNQRTKKVLSEAQRSYATLFRKIVPDEPAWEGRHCVFTSKNTVLDTDNRSLSEIYSDVPSPEPLPDIKDKIVSRLTCYEDGLSDLGLRSTLHRYQRRSVTAMLTYELSASAVPDPLFVPLSGRSAHQMFLQPGTLEILQEQPLISPLRGGILCEELGTGKTVMIIALILATRNQLSQPEIMIGQATPKIMTPLAFRHFPNFSEDRKKFPLVERRRFAPIDAGRIPTLREILIHQLSSQTALNLSTYDSTREILEKGLGVTQYHEIVKANPAFYLHYPPSTESDDPSARSLRRTVNSAPRLLYLTTATLIVVPPNLLAQWNREIQKHSEYPLRVLIVRRDTKIPSARLLAVDFDIVLTTYPRIAAENRHCDVTKLQTWTMCRCTEFSTVGVPNCRCKPPRTDSKVRISPLLQIRWKRMVIDEGHVAASLNHSIISFTKLLSVERKWIVSGTPTTNLLGLQFGSAKSVEEQFKSSDEGFNDSEETLVVDDAEPKRETTSDSEESDDEIEQDQLEIDLTPQSQVAPPRIWSRSDTKDIQKLIDMLTHFVGMKSLANTARTHVNNALADCVGPRPGAVVMLRQLMQLTMVRHRIGDVEKEVVLPGLKEEHIFLDLDELAVKSYNAFQAGLAINAVDSQRTGPDYLFEPRNAKRLMIAIKNMNQILFWSSDDQRYWVDENVEYAADVIKHAIERQVPDEDLNLVREAQLHMKIAAKDLLWKALIEHEDIIFRVSGLPQNIFNAWSRARSSTDGGLIHLDRLVRLRNVVQARPLATGPFLIEVGEELSRRDEAVRAEILKQKEKKNKSVGRLINRISTSLEGKHKEVLTASVLAFSKSVKEVEKELENEDNGMNGAPAVTQSSTLLTRSVMSGTRVHSSVSTKLNYILNEIAQYSATEKFLIFSTSALSLTFIGEGLELMGIRFLHVASDLQEKAKTLATFALAFETSETHRVFLLELKDGAWGLNLISASRIIFCEPVWQPDVESQAIKRAHRIGQTKKITVKTLAIRDTFEETMVYRRRELKGLDKDTKLIDEKGMRQYLQSPRFLESKPVPSKLDISLIDAVLPSSTTPDDSNLISVSAPPTRSPNGKRGLSIEECIEDRPSPPKKRSVRFQVM